MEALSEDVASYIISFVANIEDLLATSQINKQFAETAKKYNYPLVMRGIQWEESKWIKYTHAISKTYTNINELSIRRCNITEAALSFLLKLNMKSIDLRECRQIGHETNWMHSLNRLKTTHFALAKCTKLPEYTRLIHLTNLDHLNCLLLDRLSVNKIDFERLASAFCNVQTLAITNTDLYDIPLTLLTKLKNLKHLFLGGSNVFHRRLKHLLFNVVSIFEIIHAIEYQIKSMKNGNADYDDESCIVNMRNLDMSHIQNNDASFDDAKAQRLIQCLSLMFLVIHKLKQNGLKIIELTFWKTPNITMSKLKKYQKDKYTDVHFDGLSIAKLIFLHLLHKYYDSSLIIFDFSVYNDDLYALFSKYAHVKMAMQYVMDLAIDSFGQTVLHRCADLQWTEYAKQLLHFGVYSDCRDRRGATPLFQASVHNHYEIAQELIKNGADIFKRKSTKETPMEIACMRSNVETIKIMLKSASLDRFNDQFKYDNQWSPVHCCCISGNVEILKLLIDHGLNYSSQNVWRQSPLHICAVKGYMKCASILVSKYSLMELLIKDEFGKTAEKIAVMNKKRDVAQLIRTRIRELKFGQENGRKGNRNNGKYHRNGYSDNGDTESQNEERYYQRAYRGRRGGNNGRRYYYRRKTNQ